MEERSVYSAATARAVIRVSMSEIETFDWGQRTVDVHLGVANDLLDLSLLLEVVQSLASQAAVDLEAVDEGGDGHQAVGLDILVELLKGGLLEDNGVLGLVLDYSAKNMLVATRSFVRSAHLISISISIFRSLNDSRSPSFGYEGRAKKFGHRCHGRLDGMGWDGMGWYGDEWSWWWW